MIVQAERENKEAFSWLINPERGALGEDKVTLESVLDTVYNAKDGDDLDAAMSSTLRSISVLLGESKKRKCPNTLSDFFKDGQEIVAPTFKIQKGLMAMKKKGFLKNQGTMTRIYKATFGFGTPEAREVALLPIEWKDMESYGRIPTIDSSEYKSDASSDDE